MTLIMVQALGSVCMIVSSNRGGALLLLSYVYTIKVSGPLLGLQILFSKGSYDAQIMHQEQKQSFRGTSIY